MSNIFSTISNSPTENIFPFLVDQHESKVHELSFIQNSYIFNIIFIIFYTSKGFILLFIVVLLISLNIFLYVLTISMMIFYDYPLIFIRKMNFILKNYFCFYYFPYVSMLLISFENVRFAIHNDL